MGSTGYVMEIMEEPTAALFISSDNNSSAIGA